jgi:Uma2 family endonuclease
MASATLLTVEQYLAVHVSGEHPPEFVHGELVYRSMPKWLHSRLQALLCARLNAVGLAATELHLRVADDVIRIADLAMYRDEPAEEIPSVPPLVVIEVISPDDRYEDLLDKLEDYRHWGVPNIWVVEPRLKKFHVYDAGTLAQVKQFEISALGFNVIADELFAEVTGR